MNGIKILFMLPLIWLCSCAVMTSVQYERNIITAEYAGEMRVYNAADSILHNQQINSFEVAILLNSKRSLREMQQILCAAPVQSQSQENLCAKQRSIDSLQCKFDSVANYLRLYQAVKVWCP